MPSLDLTLVMTLTLNFQGQIWNHLYLSQNDIEQKGCESVIHDRDFLVTKVRCTG